MISFTLYGPTTATQYFGESFEWVQAINGIGSFESWTQSLIIMDLTIFFFIFFFGVFVRIVPAESKGRKLFPSHF